MIFTERNHVVPGLYPVADAFSGTVYSDVFNMEGHNHITFFVWKAVGTTGTSTITVEACDDTTPSNTSAIAFNYRASTTPDTWGAVTAATTSGFTTTAGSNQLYAIEVDAAALTAGYPYVRLACVESVDAAVLGGIFAVLSEPRYPQAVADTVLT